VGTFVDQVTELREFFVGAGNTPAGRVDPGLSIAMGKCFSAIAYGQLVAENCVPAQAEPAMVSLVFQGLIEDLSNEALRLAALFPADGTQRATLQKVVRVPGTLNKEVEGVMGTVESRFGR